MRRQTRDLFRNLFCQFILNVVVPVIISAVDSLSRIWFGTSVLVPVKAEIEIDEF